MEFMKNELSYLTLYKSKAHAISLGKPNPKFSRRTKIDGVSKNNAEFNPLTHFVYFRGNPIPRFRLLKRVQTPAQEIQLGRLIDKWTRLWAKTS